MQKHHYRLHGRTVDSPILALRIGQRATRRAARTDSHYLLGITEATQSAREIQLPPSQWGTEGVAIQLPPLQLWTEGG